MNTPIRQRFVLVHASELATLRGGNDRPRTKEGMNDLGLVNDGAVAIDGGRIVAVGGTREVLDEIGKGYESIDVSGKLITPGLIDPHVHLVFAGSREGELEDMAVKGVPYLEIKSKGGGMPITLKKTGEATTAELLDKTERILDRMLAYGTTTIEAKSGYEMTFEGEIRQLQIIAQLSKRHPIGIVPTFLAQGIPFGYENRVDELTEDIVRRWLPEIEAEAC